MKQKVGTLLEEDVLRRAKRFAVDAGRPLSDVIQDALENYLSTKVIDKTKRDEAYQLFCDRPMKLNPTQFKAVLEEDPWDL